MPKKANGSALLQRKACQVWEEIRSERGAVTRIARRLRIKPQAVHKWRLVPLGRVLELERVTGKSATELRPDYPFDRAGYKLLQQQARAKQANERNYRRISHGCRQKSSGG